MNWPGAFIIGKYLETFSNKLIGPVQHVLNSDDRVWTYWVLDTYADAFNQSFWVHCEPELKRVAFSDDDDGARTKALYILAKTKLAVSGLIQARIEQMKLEKRIELDDYAEIRAMLIRP